MKFYQNVFRNTFQLKKEMYQIPLLMVILFLMSNICMAQIGIKGNVVDGSNQPLIGVSVVVKGSTNGVITDLDGNYSITVPDINAILTFSFIGFQTQEVVVKSNRIINVTMTEDAKVLDDVVVVGYTTVKRESLTGALQTVSNEKLRDVTTPNVETMLAGKAPGLQVIPGSGQPGSAGKITLRGKATLNGSIDPLWVIDGVIVGTGSYDLNSMDVENITILKDAASTAVYGSLGANGVILVTTKKGRAGKPSINFSAKFVATDFTMGNFSVMNGAELYDYYNSLYGDKPNWFTPDIRNRNFDWEKEAIKTGFAQDYNLSISGGSENMTTYFSAGVYDESGAVKGYDFTRYTFLFKVNYSPYNWLTIRPQISGSRKDVDDKQKSLSSVYVNLPWNSPYNADGSLKPYRPDDWIYNSSTSNYLYDLQWNYNKSRTHSINGNFDFDVKILDWLTFASVNSYRYNQNTETRYVDPRSNEGQADKGSVYDLSKEYNRLYTNQLLRINKTFGLHSLNAVAGYEWNEYDYKILYSRSTGIPSGHPVQSVAMQPVQSYSNKMELAMESWLSNFNYSYDGKYLGQFSFRRDGASDFASNNKWGSFFSIGGGWNIHREDFFKLKYIDELKLRASYGSVGNRPSDADRNSNFYNWQSLYSLSLGSSYDQVSGAMRSQLGNPNLKWEKAYVFGVGLDVNFLSRFNLTVDYYYKNTSDLLFKVPLPSVIGVNGIWANAGKLTNQGFEVSVGAELLKTNNLMWRVDANLSLNRNKIKKLYNGQDQIVKSDDSGIYGGANYLYKVGENMDSYYMPQWAGVDPANGDPLWYTFDKDGNRGTTNSYAIAQQNRTIVGHATPDFYGGFSTSLIYRGFDLSANFGYSVGGRIYNYNRTTQDSDGAYLYYNAMKMKHGWKRWEKEGDIATHPKASWGNRSRSNQQSSRYLESATFLKMRSLTIGYSFPVKKLYVSNLKVFLTGENLFTITPFTGLDPELPGGRDRTAVSQYPQTRKYSIGINITL